MIQSIGIPSANKLSVSQSSASLPDVRETLYGWFRPLILVRIQTRIADHVANTEGKTELRCMGVIQPFGARELRIKAEGERAWKWNYLHVTPDVKLETGEEFRVHGVSYRVMSDSNWSEYGFISYELIQDFNNGTRSR